MATHKLHIPVSLQKLWGIFADNGQSFNKNKLPIISLVLVASMALGIFVVNIIKLVNSDTSAKTTVITERQAPPQIAPVETPLVKVAPQAAPIEAAPIQTVPQAAPVKAAPVQTAIKAVPVKATSIQTAPPNRVEEKPAAPAQKVESPDSFAIDNYLYRARGYEAKGEYSKALANYRKVLEIEKNNFIILNNVSYIYLQLDHIKESIEYSLRAINVNRDYVPALTNIGIAYAKTGDLSAAEYHLVRALKLEPANQDLILNLALLHERQDRFPEASEHYLKLVKLGNVSGALGLARVYEKEGRTAEAIKFYKNIYNNSSIDSKTRAFVRQRGFILQNKQMKTGQ